MYEVTNTSSRTFIFGHLMLLPNKPEQVTEEQRETILHSSYAVYFEFVKKEEAAITESE